jgi:nitrile hydratase beta subunit
MSSLHNLGGMQGFGLVWTVPEGTAFYTDAERRVFRLMMGLMAGGWCDTDGFRAEVEGLPVQTYARECFPVNYFLGMEKQLAERGLIQPGDLEAWMKGVKPTGRPATPPPIMTDGSEPPAPALFHVGDRVKIRGFDTQGHNRLPNYLRGQTGAITAERGLTNLPDALAARVGRKPQPVYTVEFLAQDVWGDPTAGDDRLSAEIFQDYIKAAVQP